MRVYSHSYWMVIFCTTNSSRHYWENQEYFCNFEKWASFLGNPVIKSAGFDIFLTNKNNSDHWKVAIPFPHKEIRHISLWIPPLLNSSTGVYLEKPKLVETSSGRYLGDPCSSSSDRWLFEQFDKDNALNIQTEHQGVYSIDSLLSIW